VSLSVCLYLCFSSLQQVTNNIQKFYCKNNGVLYENELIQIGVKTECRSNLARLALFFGNKTNLPCLVRREGDYPFKGGGECRSNLARLALFFGNKTNLPFLVRREGDYPFKGDGRVECPSNLARLALFFGNKTNLSFLVRREGDYPFKGGGRGGSVTSTSPGSPFTWATGSTSLSSSVLDRHHVDAGSDFPF
jgi:hypothetical protein